MMVDAGAIFKMRRSAITVGSSSPFVDRSGATLQVLGIPQQRVYFTSIADEEIGEDTTVLPTTPNPGDWGGIILRGDVDHDEQRFDYENEGIFLNSIDQAEIRYGGGAVVGDSVSGVVNPIHIVHARPNIAFNRITQSADAAMSATPDSFAETNLHSPEFQTTVFTSDYGRVGPYIRSNVITGNTTNGLFIRIPKLAGNVLQPMRVSGRFDDTDVVHVLSDNLLLEGRPGGPVEDLDTGLRSARLSARLVVDPGMIVKAEGARIEAQVGANFYAEGTRERRVVFTSLQDDRFGAGGTFDTNNSETLPVPGDWSGILVKQTGIANLDYALVAYGGGINPMEGSFAGVNAIELHQATARIAHSTFENNADGTGGLAPASRFGRGANVPATIFVRGAQPVIVDNVFRGNESPVININANALNHAIMVDPGRATGAIDRITEFGDNQGPLVRGNKLSDNATNGMKIRGGTLTTETVWDDTDIVHVLRDTIYIPNLHTFGGLRLESSPSESLVVKLLGDAAGFVTTGTQLEIVDPIGGQLEIVGQPGRPVVLTSLYDDTVGAGNDQNGQPQTDTNNGGRPTRSQPEGTFRIKLNFGPLILQNPDAVAAARRAASNWEQQFEDPMTVVVDVELASLGAPIDVLKTVGPVDPTTLMRTDAERVQIPFDEVRGALARDGGDHEALLDQLPSFNELNVILPNDPVNPFTVSESMRLTRANAKAMGFDEGSLSGQRSQFDPLGLEIRDAEILVSDDPNLWDYQRRDGLRSSREDFVSDFMRELGAVLGFSSSVDDVARALDPTSGVTRDIFMTPLDLFRFAPGHDTQDFAAAPRLLDPTAPDHVFYAGGSFDPNTLGLPVAGLQIGDIPLARGQRTNAIADNDFGAAHWLDDVFFRDEKLVEFTPLGVMDPISRFRDEVIILLDPVQSTVGLITDITEQDREAFDSIGYDAVGGTPGDWQGIRLERLTHTENTAVILEAEFAGLAAPGNNAIPESAQFIGQLAPDLRAGDDNHLLAFQLHGLPTEPGDVDLYSFTATAGTPIWLDIDRTTSSLDTIVELIDATGALLARSDNSAAEQAGDDSSLEGILDPQPLGGFDNFTTNRLDAGMQLVLPGVAGTINSYLVRVRSSSEDLDGGLFDGLTSGQYQLQIRLQAADAFPGTTVTYADIRFAETGIAIIGPPGQSPLVGTAVEDTSFNDTPFERKLPVLDDEGAPIEDTFVDHPQLPYEVSAQDLGNLLAANQGAISVFGALSTSNDVDWFEFEIDYDAVESVPGAFDLGFASAGVVFDIDYAAGLGRPNTTLSIFDRFGNLIFFGDDSDVADDLSEPGTSNGATDLSRGSASRQDPFIGPVVLAPGTYYAVVSSAAQVPADVAAGGGGFAPIIEGVTGRGLRVTGGSNDTVFQPSPNFPSGDILTGEYQLEIRYTPAPDFGFTAANASVADKNRVAVQSQLLIDSNVIRDSRTWGIEVEDGLRDLPSPRFFFDAFEFGGLEFGDFNRFFTSKDHGQFTSADYAPHSGPTRALPVLDEERIVPGLSFTNNVIAGGNEGGISLQGDPDGIVIDTYNLFALTEMFSDFGAEDIDGTEFTIWDHQRRAVTFEFDNNGGVKAGHIPVRFDLDVGNDTLIILDEFRWANPPTLPEPVAAEIEQAIRFSDLDVKVYRAESGVLFVEGAVEIGHPDVILAPFSSVFFPPDSPLPIITARKAQQGSVPFARIVNNTIVGRGGDLFEVSGEDDVAILLEDNVSPTILNNVVANFATGVQSDLSSTDTATGRRTFVSSSFPVGQAGFAVDSVFESQFDDDLGPFLIGGHGFNAFGFDQLLQNFNTDPTEYVAPRPSIIGATVYQGNLSDNLQIGIGDFPIQLGNTESLFVDPSNGNYLLEEGSRAIDSSLGRLAERERLAAIFGAVGISESDILAPRLDGFGQLRVDDPNVEPPAGFGNNVFKDRGALDRVDFVWPVAKLTGPVDNDAAGKDKNPVESAVRLVGETLDRFSLQIIDGLGAEDPSGGTGTDDRTVTSSGVVVTQDDRLLVDGIDYRFGYDTTNDVIGLTPLAGIWEPGHEYAITLSGIRDLAGNPIKPNRITGETRFTISLDIETDFGDAPLPYPTLVPDSARHTMTAGLFLGAGVTAEEDGKPTDAADGDALDDGVVFHDLLLPDSVANLTVTASADGLLDAWIDFNGDGDWNDDGEQIFASESLVAGPNDFGIVTPPTAVTGISYTRFRLSSSGGLSPSGSASDGEVEDYVLTIGITNPWQNSPNPLNVDNDAGNLISPLDALIVINELNNPQFSDPETGALPIPPPVPPGASSDAPFFYDVDGDGFIAPLDALLVINALNSQVASQAGVAATAVADADPVVVLSSGERLEQLSDATDAALSLHPDTGRVAATRPQRSDEEPVRAADMVSDSVSTAVDAVYTVKEGGSRDSATARPAQPRRSKTDTLDVDSVLNDIAADILAGWNDQQA
ncbi:MAG: NF038122 family metalloprotease [Pirellulales bacterium]